ncbi:MAG: NAD(P)(+) transhydrogenase (Re/Si-specific) subunit alpha, partial [Verrucomicrobia bacterium]
MLIAVPKEILPDENRVALIPSSISALTKAGMEVLVESGAGAGCFYDNRAYEEAGAKIAPNADALYQAADILFKVRPPESTEVDKLREGSSLICLMD